LARRTLDAIVNAFHEQNLARSSAEAQKSLEFVQSQMPEAQARLQAAEAALNGYRAAQRSVDLSFETQSLLSQTQTTEEKLLELAQSEEDIKRKYAPDHPIYKQLLDNRGALQAHLDSLNAQIGTLPETQKQVLNMTRDLATAQAATQAQVQAAAQVAAQAQAAAQAAAQVAAQAQAAAQAAAQVRDQGLSPSLPRGWMIAGGVVVGVGVLTTLVALFRRRR
jgi:tyrosine-protein kinase Etk/Wzc